MRSLDNNMHKFPGDSRTVSPVLLLVFAIKKLSPVFSYSFYYKLEKVPREARIPPAGVLS